MVQMNAIRAILALVPIKFLKIQQMEIKGAYLNWKLKEKCQPEEYKDNVDLICELIKTLYGLKQSGCEWNIEFDRKMKGFGFK